jgi:hypothetical protein
MIIDVVEMVRTGEARYEWHWIISERRGHKLFVAVMRDAMKFDGLPMLNWHRDDRATLDGNFGIGDARNLGSVFDGVRLPASARELQQIADLIGGMLMTPRIIDLVWLQAGIKFDAIIGSGEPYNRRLADVNVTAAHQLIERRLGELGGDDVTQLVDSVGKQWCLVNELADGVSLDGRKLGPDIACNYGWCSEGGSGPGLTQGVRCWQRPGFRHPDSHLDPSQTIRLMYTQGWYVPPNGEAAPVDLREIADDPALAFLLTHDGKRLRYLRQAGVPEEALLQEIATPPVTDDVPMVLMPPTVISISESSPPS